MKNDGSLKEKTIKGIVWKGLERVAAQLISAIVAIVLARILIPEDYSVVSIVTIFFAFCNIFITGGLSTALIQKKDADTLDYSTMFVVNIVFAAVLAVIMFFAAPFIAVLYQKEILTPIIRAMTITFFINGYKSIVSAKILSDMRFRDFFWSTIIGTIISAIVGIAMALSGFGAWALVLQQMSNSFIDALVLTFSSRIKIRLEFSKTRFKQLFSFGGKILLSSFINEGYNQLKPIIVGLRYSTIDLAYYNKGKLYPNMIAATGSDTLSSSLFPAMSKVQDDKKTILNITRRFMQISSFVVFPLMIGFMAISDGFVRVVLTEKWVPIVPYLMIFCLSEMFKPIQTGNLQAIRAIGRSDVYLKLEVIKKTSYLIIIALFVVLGNTPVLLAASSIFTSVLASIINSVPNRKLIDYSYKNQLKDVGINFISSIAMGCIVYSLNYLPIHIGIRLMLQIATGVLLYFLIGIITKNPSLKYLLSLLKRKPQKTQIEE